MNTALSGGRNGPGRHPTPGNFSVNWLKSTEVCDGKMIYSSFCLLESVILKPFYNNYVSKCREMIGKHLSLGPDNDYDTARSVTNFLGNRALSYHIQDVSGSDNEYKNTFSALWSQTSTGVTILLAGVIHLKKTNSTNVGLGNATSWASLDEEWNSTINLDIAFDNGAQRPYIKASPPKMNTTKHEANSGQNTLAKTTGVFGKIFDGVVDFFNIFGADLSSDLEGSWSAHVDGMPSVDVAMGNLYDTVNGSFVLPAGDVFFFKNINILPSGTTEFQVTYKSETGDSRPEPSTNLPVAPGFPIPPEPHVATGFPQPPSALQDASSAAQNVVPSIESAKMVVEKHVNAPEKVDSTGFPPLEDIAVRVEPMATAKAVVEEATRGGSVPSKKQTTAESPQSLTSGAPIVDQFSLMSLNDPPAEAIGVSVSAELMHNSQLGLPVSPSTDMCVIQDSGGSPYIMTISTDERLNVLCSASGTTAGWSTINILNAFPAYVSAVAFDIVQDGSGYISVAMALRKDKSEQIDVFFANLISNDDLEGSFRGISSLAKQVIGLDPAMATHGLTLGSSDNGKAPLLTIEGTINSKHYFYQVTANTLQAERNEFVEQVKAGKENLLHHCSGFSFGQQSICFLYEVNGARHLVAQSIADDNGSSISYDYSPGNTDLPSPYRQLEYNIMTMVTSRFDPDFAASDLYIGARSGIYRIPNGKHSKMELISDIVKDVHEIAASVHGNEISLWVTASPNRLYYIYGQRTSDFTVKWNMPILFASDVLAVASMRSTSKSANEIFVLNQNMTLTQYWQDPQTTTWRNKTSSVDKNKYVLNFDSYTTHIHLESKGLPITDKVRITSSEWQYCTINGLVYSLDQDTPAEITADALGNITIIESAIDISPPVLHLQSDAFAEIIDIYPGGKIHAGLGAVKVGDDLTSINTQDGQPLLAKDIKPGIADGVAKQISALHSAADQKFPPSLEGKTFVALRKLTTSAFGAKFIPVHQAMNAKISADHLPNNFTVEGTFQDGGLQLLDPGSVVVPRTRARFSISNVTDFPGDVWHHVEQLGDSILSAGESGLVKLSDGVSFILSKAGDALHFMLNLAGQAIDIVLDTVAQVYKAMNYVFKLIGVGLKEFMKWLGHLLGWDHIWNTHKMIAGAMKGMSPTPGRFVDFVASDGKKYIEIARTATSIAFADLDQVVKNSVLPDGLKNSTTIQAANASNKSSTAGIAIHSPQANFAAYHYAHSDQDSQSANSHTVTTEPKLSIEDPFVQFYEDVIKPIADVLWEKLKQDGNDLVNIFKHGDLDSIRIFVVDMADTIISVIGALVDGILHFVEDLLGDLQALLEQEWDIPIISQLYEFATSLFGESEKFTIINGLAFLLAIPAVVIMKIAGVGYPEENNAIGMDQPGFPHKLEGLIQRQQSVTQNLVPKQAGIESSTVEGLDFTAESLKIHPTAMHMNISDDQASRIAPYSALAGMFASLLGIYGNCKDLKGGQEDVLPEGEILPLETSQMAISFFKDAFGFPMPTQLESPGSYTVRCIASITTGAWNISSEVFKNAKTIKELKIIIQTVLDLFCSFAAIAVNYVEKNNVSTAQVIADFCSNFGGLLLNLGKECIKRPGSETGGEFLKYLGGLACLSGSVTGVVFSIQALEDGKTWRVINVGG
ncbi:hypothetical protein BGZ60DRAFT_534628 [Tricladium varicosporioides]|nr:hypothetical protein BGZ60DRAFT_534628 [Hymenoscyphus varicosporioides]